MTGHGIGLYPVDKQQDTSIADVPNLLLQKWIAPEFTAVTELAADTIGEGDIAGMVSLGVDYGAVALKRENGVLSMVAISGSQTFKMRRHIPRTRWLSLKGLISCSSTPLRTAGKYFSETALSCFLSLKRMSQEI